MRAWVRVMGLAAIRAAGDACGGIDGDRATAGFGRLGTGRGWFQGFVFNDMDTTRQRYRYGYKGYVYHYSYKKS